MYVDKIPRLISYHDSWMSIDPIKGCPYGCVYCVLRHSGINKTKPKVSVSPKDCVEEMLQHPFFRMGKTFLAIGNETDMFYRSNQNYLLQLLEEFSKNKISNPICLITKSPLDHTILTKVRAFPNLTILLFLSYSGLGSDYEPNFPAERLEENFDLAKESGFPIIHYWRPLLPANTKLDDIQRMLHFVSSRANASVIVGLKLHPELVQIWEEDQSIEIPAHLKQQHGEWIDLETVSMIHKTAETINPSYPIYRHTSCALASVLNRPNHTATVFRKDICLPSRCLQAQRQICAQNMAIPDEAQISTVLGMIGKSYAFTRGNDRIVIQGVVNQEEYAYLLHSLGCPISVEKVNFENLYRGSIYDPAK